VAGRAPPPRRRWRPRSASVPPPPPSAAAVPGQQSVARVQPVPFRESPAHRAWRRRKACSPLPAVRLPRPVAVLAPEVSVDVCVLELHSHDQGQVLLAEEERAVSGVRPSGRPRVGWLRRAGQAPPVTAGPPHLRCAGCGVLPEIDAREEGPRAGLGASAVMARSRASGGSGTTFVDPTSHVRRRARPPAQEEARRILRVSQDTARRPPRCRCTPTWVARLSTLDAALERSARIAHRSVGGGRRDVQRPSLSAPMASAAPGPRPSRMLRDAGWTRCVRPPLRQLTRRK
jgi:hypothetical protein